MAPQKNVCECARNKKMANILNFIIENQNMAIYSFEITETNEKIQKTAGLDLNNKVL
jgi:hypothetical protein